MQTKMNLRLTKTIFKINQICGDWGLTKDAIKV